MSIEIIKARHTPLAFSMMLAGYIATRYVATDLYELVNNLYETLTYPVLFFPMALSGVVFQYFENKYCWSKLLNLADHYSFMGVSIGATVGLLSLSLW